MKASAALLLLLTLSCASSDGFITKRTFDCSPGQDVTVQAGVQSSQAGGMEGIDDRHSLSVLVANNTDGDIEVKFIRADQVPDAMVGYRLDSGYGEFHRTIAEGEDFEFTIPMSGRSVQREISSRELRDDSIFVDVTTGLANGDRYVCRFQIALRR